MVFDGKSMHMAVVIGLAVAMVGMFAATVSGHHKAGHDKGPGPLEVNAEVYPESLNLRSNGRFVTVTVEVTGGNKTAGDIAPDTVELEGLPRLGPNAAVDTDGNFTAKYDRADLEDLLSPADAVTLTVEGEFTDGEAFSDTDDIKVL